METIKHKKETTKSHKPLLVILLLVILVAVAGALGWYLYQNLSQDDVMEPNAVVGSMPGKTQAQIEEELTRQVSEKEVAFSINSAPVFETGADAGNILFENPKNNNKLTRVEITLDETGELLYKSGLLEPGSYVPESKLKKDLEPGEYTCTATVYAYRQDDNAFIGKVAAGITIVVKG